MFKCASRFAVLASSFLLFSAVDAHAQMTVEFETTENTNCLGSECDYSGPGILINELMIAPLSGDGSLWGGNTNQRAEWIELYNPNFCEPVDISCYYLGNNANDPLPYPGGYVIPEGTVVPPSGFVIIRGVNAAPVPANLLIENGGNTIELVVENDANITGQVCVGGGTRLWFPNAGGWFAFYDSFGEPQDAVSWANSSNVEQQPCVPPFPSCQSANSLVSYNDFPDDRKEYVLNVSAATFQGQSIRRLPDGGDWSGAGPATYGTCNAECIDPGTSSCNGTATAIVTGGVPPYWYQWDDAQIQTTQTAEGLCAQEYCVSVFDDNGDEVFACVTITQPSYETDDSASICAGDGFTLPDNTVVSEAGTYPVMLQTAGGCDSLVTLELTVFPSYSFELNPTICENNSYTLPDGSDVTEAGVYTVVFETTDGCDSTFIVTLEVDPTITIPQSPEICEGEVYTLPDGTEVTEGGLYDVFIEGGADCDTLYQVNLTVHPSYLILQEADICEGEIYQLPGGTAANQTGVYTISFNTGQGCDSIIEVFLNVNPLPELTIPLAAVYCFGTGTVAVNPSPSGGTLTGPFVDGNNLNLGNANPGSFTVTYNYTDENGCSNTLVNDYSVAPPVFPEFTWDSGCLGVANFTNLTDDPEQENSYIWAVGEDETVFGTSFNAQLNVPESGTYFITLTAINPADCPYSVSLEVELEAGLELGAYQLPNVITPNRDGINDRFGLMPEDDDCLNYRITFFNRWGKKVYEMTEQGTPFMGLDERGNELSEGVYFYIFESPQIDCTNPLFEDLCKGNVQIFR